MNNNKIDILNDENLKKIVGGQISSKPRKILINTLNTVAGVAGVITAVVLGLSYYKKTHFPSATYSYCSNTPSDCSISFKGPDGSMTVVYVNEDKKLMTKAQNISNSTAIWSLVPGLSGLWNGLGVKETTPQEFVESYGLTVASK